MSRTTWLAAIACGVLALGALPTLSTCALSAGAAWGQNMGDRTVSGTISDVSSQPVVGATVFLKNEKTKAIRSYISTADGHFRFSQVDMSVDFDLWVCDVTSGEHRRLYAGGAWCQPASGFSPDGRWVSLLQPGPRPLDTELLLVEVATAKVQPILAHPDEAAEVGPPVWWDATERLSFASISPRVNLRSRSQMAPGTRTRWRLSQASSWLWSRTATAPIASHWSTPAASLSRSRFP